MSSSRLLITGASGKLGQSVLNHLLDTFQVSPARIVAASRNPSSLESYVNKGIELRTFDTTKLETFDAAVDGIDRILLISTLHSPDEKISEFLDVAAKKNVQHIMYTSFQNVDKSLAHFAPAFVRDEEVIRSSKIPHYTMLQNGFYFENAFHMFKAAKKTGQWYTAAKQGKLSALSIDDLGLADAAALITENPEKEYVLTGIEALTADQFVQEMNQILGTSIEVVHSSAEEASKHLSTTLSIPSHFADLIISMDVSNAANNSEEVTDEFKKLTGHEPMKHIEWLKLHKDKLLAM